MDQLQGRNSAAFHRCMLAVFVLTALVLFFAAFPTNVILTGSGDAFIPNSSSSSMDVAVSAGGKEYFNATAVSTMVANETKEEVELQRILTIAAMENNTVILTTLNSAWSEPNSIIDLFLESFRTGENTIELLNHLVIIALDEMAYKRCVSIHPHCFALKTKGVDFSGQKDFLTDGYLKMMWRRIDFLRSVLQMGYNFIFTDADIMWFRNPLQHFYVNGDFQIACDQFYGNSTDLHNSPNGGFNYVRSNNRTIEFYKFWHESRLKYPGNHDQDVLNFIKFDPFIKEIELEIRFLDTVYFGGICEPSRDFSKVCTMHANCCIGLEKKINDLKVMLEDWREFMALPSETKQSAEKKTWRVPQKC